MGKIIQIMAEPNQNSRIVLYALDDLGQIWFLQWSNEGYYWVVPDMKEK